MSTMNLTITAGRRRHALSWGHVQQTVDEWRRRSHSRSELATLSDRSLRDIGLSRSPADFEAAKPFWMV